MTNTSTHIEIRNDSAGVYEQFRNARHQTLVGVEDDMWATFADMAEPYALLLDEQVIGSCSIDEDNQLHAFHVNGDFEANALEVLAHIVDTMGITAAMASTVDPAFLSLGLSIADRTNIVGLMYEHVADSEVTEPIEVRLASVEDQSAVVGFYAVETGSPAAFLEYYLAARIEKNELYLMDGSGGKIAATGECRVDQRAVGHAHLGLVVGTEFRGQGVGGRMMQRMVDLAKGQGLAPLCSTDPTNVAAQRLIHRTGFRTRHSVLGLMTAEGS